MLTRILFVDDEPRVLDGLRRTLRAFRSEWDVSFAPGGAEALDVLAGAPFDVIVTDMRMPEVNGLALLTAVRDRWPHMVRIVLSGYMDMEAAVRATSVAHQFLSKPCDPGELRDAIGRTASVARLVGDPALRAAVGEIGALAVRPAAYVAIERAAADPDGGVADVSRIVEGEVPLAAKMVQLANSSFFGHPRRAGTVADAVAYLGVEMVRALVLVHEVAELTRARGLAPDFSLARHQAHALRVARVARTIAGGGAAADEAFLAGLLHDVGELVLAAQRHEWLDASAAHAARRRIPLHEAEAELYGVTHAEVGAYLASLWGLPFDIVESIAHHHAPRRAGRPATVDTLAAVHIADALVDASSAPPGVPPAPLDAPFVDGLRVGAHLEAWRAVAAGPEPP